MGSSPSKVVRVRSRSGLSFVSTSSTESLNTIATDIFDEPEGVKNFVFDEITIKTFRVGWDPPDNFDAVSYQVRLFPPDKIKSKTLLRALPETRHTFTRLSSCTQYTVAVIAIDANNRKSPCQTDTVWTLPRPPRNIQFPSSTRSDSLQVSWKHSKGKPGNYSVDVTPVGNQEPIAHAVGLKQTSHVFKDIIPGTEYKVTVISIMHGQGSEPLTGIFMTAPRYVCDITFSDVTQHEMTWKWKKPEGTVDSYTLELSENTWKPGKPIVIQGLKKTFYTFNGLTPGRLYNCKITSKSKNKSSKPQVFTQCTVPLEVVGIATRDIDAEEALVTWIAPTGDVDDYDLFLSPKQGVTGETSPRGVRGTQYKFTGLVPGTTYTVGIVTNSKDKTSKRVVSSFITVPGMCGDINISDSERTSTTQRISWPIASGRVDSYAISIRREDKQQEGWTINDVFQTNYLITGLSPGTSYKVEVAAMRDGRESSSVHKIFGTVPSVVPSIFFPKEQCSFDRITCSWETSVGGVDSYLVEAKCEGGVTIEKTVSSETSNYTFTSLHSATIYVFSVTVLCNGIKSAPKTAKQITGPPSVCNFQASSSSKREISVSWTPPDHGADEYILSLLSLEEGGTESPIKFPTSQQKHTFSGLIPGVLHNVEIIPVASSIKGKSSATQVYTKPGDILNVHIPEDLVSLNSITVTWWGVEGNCKDVDVTLSRIEKSQDLNRETNPTVIKEEHVLATDAGSNEVTFTNLEPDTLYGIRLRAVGKAGVGNYAVFTQATLAAVVKEEIEDEKIVEEVVLTRTTKETQSKQDESIVDSKEITQPSEDSKSEIVPSVQSTDPTESAAEIKLEIHETEKSMEENSPPTTQNETSLPPQKDPLLPPKVASSPPLLKHAITPPLLEETSMLMNPSSEENKSPGESLPPTDNNSKQEEIIAQNLASDIEVKPSTPPAEAQREENLKASINPELKQEEENNSTQVEDDVKPETTESELSKAGDVSTESQKVAELDQQEPMKPGDSNGKTSPTVETDAIAQVHDSIPETNVQINPVLVLPTKESETTLSNGYVANSEQTNQQLNEAEKPAETETASHTSSPTTEIREENRLAFLASLTSD